MSIPTLQGLQTALSGLLGEQAALDVTANNIANSNTEGYTRQTAVLTSNPALALPSIGSLNGTGAQLGTGVDVAAITRIRSAYLDGQYRVQNSALGSASTLAEALGQAQAVFGEPSSSGLASQLSAFWSAWGALSQTPSSEAAREAVVGAGEQLARTLNSLGSQLQQVSAVAVERISALAGEGGEVSRLAGQIAQLNGQITLAEGAAQKPNELLDQRDLALDKLSSLAHVSVHEQGDGSVTVSIGSAAKPLVEGTVVNWPQTLTGAAGGQLGALLSLTAPGGQLASYRSALDAIASDLATSVNALQPATPFFSGATAATIAVAAQPAQIQTSSTGEAGGNDLALAIAELRGGSSEQGYAALIAHVGGAVRAAKDEQADAQATLNALSDQRQSVSGVSLDEEMTNLISFQRGYQASARTLTAMDQMLEQLIEHTGTVGL